MKFHEVDMTGQMIFNLSLPNKGESYHTGTFVDCPKPFKVLLLSGGAEVKAIKKTKVIPITELTDAVNQLDPRGLESVKLDEIDPEFPEAWVQDSPVARKALSQFIEKKPQYDVHSDPIADALF